MFVIRLCDMGCVQNALPVGVALQDQGADVRAYVDAGSIAEEKFRDELPRIDIIHKDAVVVSCLPLGHGYKATLESQARVVLIQENPDWNDQRFGQWCRYEHLSAICSVSRQSTRQHPLTRVTGLPVLDAAAQDMIVVNEKEVRLRIGVPQNATVISVALPGDRAGCERMLLRVQELSEGKVVVARSHPKLQRQDPEGFDSIAGLVSRMGSMSLAEMNKNVSSAEAMALGLDGNFFVTTHDSTMAWQAAAGGVQNVFIIPPTDQDVETWASDAPIITSSFGQPFTGLLLPRSIGKSMVTGYAVNAISKIATRA